MEKKDLGIGYIPIQMLRDGVTDFDVVSESMHHLKLEMLEEGTFSFDRYTKMGSDIASTVMSPKAEDRECILWCINHYLGFNRHPSVIKAAKDAVEKFGTGSGTSSMSGGRSSLHRLLEERIANLLGKEGVILYSTGYTANLSVLASLPGANDLIIADDEVHASIRDGMKFSGRRKMFFKHNDVHDLERLLKKHTGKYEHIFVVVESAYSMSGDLAPLREIAFLKKKYEFLLYLDEAHTFGFYGDQGKGYAAEQGVLADVDLFMSTLSKSTAAIGGFVALKEKYKTYLSFKSTAYLFQASFSPVTAATIHAALDLIQYQPGHALQLHRNNQYMRQELEAIGFNLRQSASPIIPIYIADVQVLTAFSRDLFLSGIYTITIIYPAVPPQEGRIRFIVSASHTKEQMDKTLHVLNNLAQKYRLFGQTAAT
ncbi:MAG TPA: aminotransferase class I/II-fold pyridoxal phosphate-dependent enzyme [Pseudosphingobacterium sp.]|nr:aminotransferase class I/II-fold pyridoxal phosphate-dependent enzyme [Pseudosphingobacterium sp.]